MNIISINHYNGYNLNLKQYADGDYQVNITVPRTGDVVFVTHYNIDKEAVLYEAKDWVNGKTLIEALRR